MSRKPLTQAQKRRRAAWVFSSLLLVVLVGAVVLDRDHLSGVSQPILAVLAALLGGLMTFFLTGDLGIQLPWLKAGGGMGVFALVLILWPKLLPSPELYRVQVTVVGPKGEVVDSAEIFSSPTGTKKKVDGGWELEIPAGSLPESRQLTIRAQDPKTTSRGRSELSLGKDLQPTVEIKLPEVLADVEGVVLGSREQPVPKARVSVNGDENEAVETGPTGEFRLASHVAPGTMVQLVVRKKGFHDKYQDHPAGSGRVTLYLEKE